MNRQKQMKIITPGSGATMQNQSEIARQNQGEATGHKQGRKTKTTQSLRIWGIAALMLAIACVALFGACEKSVPETETSESAAAIPPPPQESWILPFTGEETGDPYILKTRPISVKIENSDAARPQMGINFADIVYETEVEGGITRFNCLFHSRLPEEIGPVRSARLSDLWIVPQYQGLFFYSGSNQEVAGKIRRSDIDDLSHSRAEEVYHRVKFRDAPHNLYLDLRAAYDAAEADRISIRTDGLPTLYYGETAVAPTSTSSAVTVTFSYAAKVRWEWDEARGVYLRSQNGKIHTEAITDEQVYSTNIVLIYADYPRASTPDPAGSPTYDTVLGGTGKAVVMKDGVVYDCTWSADADTPPVFLDEGGQQIGLNPGRTWILVAKNKVTTVNFEE
jgi:hypothetical protein